MRKYACCYAQGRSGPASFAPDIAGGHAADFETIVAEHFPRAGVARQPTWALCTPVEDHFRPLGCHCWLVQQ